MFRSFPLICASAMPGFFDSNAGLWMSPSVRNRATPSAPLLPASCRDSVSFVDGEVMISESGNLQCFTVTKKTA
jgi:hypothetical protein